MEPPPRDRKPSGPTGPGNQPDPSGYPEKWGFPTEPGKFVWGKRGIWPDPAFIKLPTFRDPHPVLFHYLIDTLPQDVAANSALLNAQDFTLG